MKEFRTAAYVLCLVPWIILPSCFGQFGTPNPLALISDNMMAFVILILFTPIIVVLEIVAAAKSPGNQAIGLWIAAIVALSPLLYVMASIDRAIAHSSN